MVICKITKLECSECTPCCGHKGIEKEEKLSSEEFTKRYFEMDSKEHKIKENHTKGIGMKISNEINKSVSKAISDYYTFGEAYILATVQYLLNQDCDIDEMKKYIKEVIDTNVELKDYVFEIMKDF